MKILYAIQGTGNGHMARATEIVPILQELAETDVLVSGIQTDLKAPFPIKYQFYGMSFIFGKHGGVNIWKTLVRFNLLRFLRDIRHLPVHEYDLVICDFEPVSAWACRLQRKLCIGLSHQNAVLHPNAPRPAFRDRLGEIILKHYAPCPINYGFHFQRISPEIFTPVIRSSIRKATASNEGHFTVYLPAFADDQIIRVLSKIGNIRWQVFSKHTSESYDSGHIHIEPVSLHRFTQSFLSCEGLLCTAGFEGPAEALYLGKKLCVIPMQNQYEQFLNAAFLESMGILVLKNFHHSEELIRKWTQAVPPHQIDYPDQTRAILSSLVLQHQPSLHAFNASFI
jgi:uncharacterized protein (TIGR00661 family)